MSDTEFVEEMRAYARGHCGDLPQLCVACRLIRIVDTLRQQLADAEAQRDLAKRLVSRLPLCPDHRDKFLPEHCQACRAERAEARVVELEESNLKWFEEAKKAHAEAQELEEALLFTDERPPVPCDFDLAGICKAHYGGRVYQCLVVAGERLVKRRAALARRRT